MKKALFGMVFGLLVMPVWGQPDDKKVVVFGGYAYTNLSDSSLNYHGFNAQVGIHLTEWMSVVGDFSGGYEIDSSIHFVGVGPEFHTSGMTRGFVHFLVGAVITEADVPRFEGDNMFGTAIGGGVDIGVTQHLAIRAVQADWIHAFAEGRGGDMARISVGVVGRF